MQRVLITGAGGALGSALIRVLAQGQTQVRALLPNPMDLSRTGADPISHICMGSALDPSSLSAAMRECDAVVSCVDFAPADYAKHIELTSQLIQAAQATGARVLYPSPPWAKGLGEGGRITESAARAPCSQLGALRARAETLLIERATLARVPFLIVRLPMLYGPACHPPFVHPVIEAAMRAESIRWPGPLEVRRDLLYVDDAARALALALERWPPVEELVIASHTPVSGAELCQILSDSTGARSQVKGTPSWIQKLFKWTAPARFEPTDLLYTLNTEVLHDGRLAAKELDFSPGTPLRQGLMETLRWLRGHTPPPLPPPSD